MTLLRLVQRASILAGMILAGFSFHSDPSHADDGQFCVTASNGKTACGKIKIIERLCVTTDGNNSISIVRTDSGGQRAVVEQRWVVRMGFNQSLVKV
jgi:hypothetical protein